MSIEIKKITKDDRDFFEIRKSKEIENVNWWFIEVFWEPQILEMYDLEWKKRLLEKMIESQTEELNEINIIINKIKELWQTK